MNAQTKNTPAASVYAKIAAVQGDLAKVGIAKNRRNQQGSGYNFRGIDDVYSALSPLLATHGLVIVPRVISRECVERASKNGGALFYVTVHAEFDFVSADDGSVHTAATFGEAMDSGDKATNKAMSAAYKYAAFMTFAIPTEGDNDADAHTPEVAPQGQRRESKVSPEVPPALISHDDATKVISICSALGGTVQSDILAGYKVNSINDLPARVVPAVFKRLDEKMAEKVAAASNAKAGFGEVLEDEIAY